MSGLFGGGATKQAERQAREAREMRQESNEQAMREQQRAERGGASGARTRGRNMLVGQLSSALKQQLGE